MLTSQNVQVLPPKIQEKCRVARPTIVAENPDDLILEAMVAMKNKFGLSAIASTINFYPTQAEAIRKLGDQLNKTRFTLLMRAAITMDVQTKQSMNVSKIRFLKRHSFSGCETTFVYLYNEQDETGGDSEEVARISIPEFLLHDREDRT